MIAAKPLTVHNTFIIERTYPQSIGRVYAAFARPELKQRWYGAGTYEFETDFRVGGHEVARSRFGEGHPLAGMELENRSIYEDIVPESRIIVAAVMSLSGTPISVVLVTFEFVVADAGTNLICTHQGAFFENSGGPEMREQGWNSLFDRLGQELAQTA